MALPTDCAMLPDERCRALHTAVSYRQLWNTLSGWLPRHFKTINIVLFAEVVDQTFPQVLLSTDKIYHSLPPDHLHGMILESPLLAYLRSNPRQRIVRWEDCLGTEERLLADPHFQAYLQPHGWRYFTTLCFYRQAELAASLILTRDVETGNFKKADYADIKELHYHLRPVVDRCSTCFRHETERRSLRAWASTMEVGSILLDWDLRPIASTLNGQNACLRWRYGAERARLYQKHANGDLPESLLKAAQRIKSRAYQTLRRYREPRKLPHETVVHSEDPLLSAEVSLIPPAAKTLGLPHLRIDFAIAPETLAAGGSDEIAGATLPHAFAILTPSEREVIAKVREGLSNQEIALSTRRAIGTVKNQISSAYAKLRVGSRTQLLRRYGGQ